MVSKTRPAPQFRTKNCEYVRQFWLFRGLRPTFLTDCGKSHRFAAELSLNAAKPVNLESVAAQHICRAGAACTSPPNGGNS
jgi:hypothetical protein